MTRCLVRWVPRNVKVVVTNKHTSLHYSYSSMKSGKKIYSTIHHPQQLQSQGNEKYLYHLMGRKIGMIISNPSATFTTFDFSFDFY